MKPDKITDAVELRHQAEVKLKKNKQGKLTGSGKMAEMQRLLHELEVHQIELEMQNEELMQSRAEVESILRQYTDLYDFAKVGYFTLDRDGKIRQSNLTGTHLLGVERSRLMNRRFGLFVSDDSRPVFNTFLNKVFESRERETCEVTLLKKGDEQLYVEIEARISENEQECRAVVVDITARKRAELELRYLSIHDALTGLYNRRIFEDEMERLERGRQFPISIVMLDVDGLKETNDHAGHAAGDELLKRVAQLLTDAFRADDIIARIGGDEFAVLLPNTDTTVAASALRRLQFVLQEVDAAYTGAPLRFSVGVSTAETPKPLIDVLREADEVMYREKAKKKNNRSNYRW